MGQERDSKSAAVARDGLAVPSCLADFGAGLGALRTESLRQLALKQGGRAGQMVLSKSQLDRSERGEVLPPLKYAKHLDRLYEADGWVEASLGTLWRRRWNPWRQQHGVAANLHTGAWPAAYQGVVWIKVRTRPENLASVHSLMLDWGPWRQIRKQVLADGGTTFLTGKHADVDGIAVPSNLSVDMPVFALYGIGDKLDGEDVVDIRSGWKRRDGD